MTKTIGLFDIAFTAQNIGLTDIGICQYLTIGCPAPIHCIDTPRGDLELHQ